MAAVHGVRKNKNHKTEKRTIPSVALEQAHITNEPWHELAMSLESDAAFGRAATKAKIPLEDLGNSQKFLSEDSKSGFAIRQDGEIVSLFNTSDRRGSNRAALMLAVQNGGTRVSAPDGTATHAYAQVGFKATGRVKRRGKPDLVLMEYDPQSNGTYTPGEGS